MVIHWALLSIPLPPTYTQVMQVVSELLDSSLSTSSPSWVPLGHLPAVVSEHLAPLIDRGLIQTRCRVKDHAHTLSDYSDDGGGGGSGGTGVPPRQPSSMRILVEAWPSAEAEEEEAGRGATTLLSLPLAGLEAGEAVIIEALGAAARCAAESLVAGEVLHGGFGLILREIG